MIIFIVNTALGFGSKGVMAAAGICALSWIYWGLEALRKDIHLWNSKRHAAHWKHNWRRQFGLQGYSGSRYSAGCKVLNSRIIFSGATSAIVFAAEIVL